MSNKKRIVFLFPGQGTQKIGMAKDIYDKYVSFRKLFEDAEKWTGIDLEKLIFEENDNINQTEYTQLAILSVELGILRILRENNIFPCILAGYSLGEYGALVASGALGEKDALVLVRQRGKLMASTVKNGVGGMAAVLGMDVKAVEEVVREYKSVQIANYNTQSQVSIAGLKEEVEDCSEKLKVKGARRVVVLNVSGPFHSSLLHPASEKFSQFLSPCAINNLDVPYYPNLTGVKKSDNNSIKDYLCKQISSPVLWSQTMENMLRDDNVTHIVECGPGNVLRGFLRSFETQGVCQYGTSNCEELEKTILDLQ